MALLLLLALQDVDDLIRKLGDDSVDVREEAQENLFKLGTSIEKELREHADSKDAEVCARVAWLLRAVGLRKAGLSDRWIKSNPELVRRLLDGSPDDFGTVIRETRGISPGEERDFVSPGAPLHGSEAAALLNYILDRIASEPPDDATLRRLSCTIAYACVWLGEGGGARGDLASGFDLVRLLTILPDDPDGRVQDAIRDALGLSREAAINASVLKAKIRWESVPIGALHESLKSKRTPELLPELLILTEDPRYFLREMAADLMGEWRTDPEKSIPALRELLEDPEGAVTAASLRSLIALGDKEVKGRVGGFLKSRSPKVRAAALGGAVHFRLKETDAAVLDALESEDGEEKEAACRAAGGLAVESAAARLKEIVREDRSDELAGIAMSVLPLTGADVSSNDLLATYVDRKNPRGYSGRQIGPAMILTGRPPSLEPLSDLWSKGTKLNSPLALVYAAVEADEETRDAMDAIFTKTFVDDSSWILGFYARADPERLRRDVFEMLKSDNPKILKEALYHAGMGFVAVPEEMVARIVDHADPWASTQAASYAAERNYGNLASDIRGLLKRLRRSEVGHSIFVDSAVRALGRLKCEAALEDLVVLGDDPEFDDTETLAEAIGAIGSEPCRTDVDRWLSSNDGRQLQLAIGVLGYSTNAKDLERVEERLSDSRDQVRAAAVLAWARASKAASNETLRRFADDPSRKVKEAVAKAMEIRSEIDPETLVKLTDLRWSTQRLASKQFLSGKLTREQVEPALRRALGNPGPLQDLAARVYLDEGWPDGIDSDDVLMLLDRGDDEAFLDGLKVLPRIYDPWRGESAAATFAALNAFTDKRAYGKLKGTRVKRGQGPSEIAKAAGLKFADERKLAIEWPEGRDELSAVDYLITLTGDARLRVAPIMKDGELTFVDWNDAIQFWRAEHVRRARERRP